MLYNDNFAFTEFDGPGTHPYMFKLQKTDSYNLIQYNKTNMRPDRVCVIRGSDKPMVYVNNDKLLFAFNESVTHGGPLEYEKFGYKIENFFWSYESPLIPIKQSHIILDLIKNNESLKTRFKAGRVGEEYMRKHVCKYIYNHSHEIDFIANKNINTDKVNPDKTAYYLLKKNNNLNSAFYNRRKFYLENYKFLNGVDLVASKISYVIGEV
jgi:hypothetical protein